MASAIVVVSTLRLKGLFGLQQVQADRLRWLYGFLILSFLSYFTLSIFVGDTLTKCVFFCCCFFFVFFFVCLFCIIFFCLWVHFSGAFFIDSSSVYLCFRWQNKDKSTLQKLLALGAVLHLLGNLATTNVFLYSSHLNYPGGEAIYRLQQLEPPGKGES